MNDLIRQRACILFSSLSNPVRMRIVELLTTCELSVSEICEKLALKQSATSQNLADLTRAGVLTVTQHGNQRMFTARGPRIGAILNLIEQFCELHNLYGDSVFGNSAFDSSSPGIVRVVSEQDVK